MKKLALALMAASAALFGMGIVASANGYDESLVVTPSAPDAGGEYTVTYNNCNTRETIEFKQADSDPDSIISPCEPVAGIAPASLVGLLLPQQQAELGVATATFTAPTEPGTYNGTAEGELSPLLPFQFMIEADDTTTTSTATTTSMATTTTMAAGQPTLPETGSDATRTMTGVAVGLLVIGLGLFVVAQVRRRQSIV